MVTTGTVRITLFALLVAAFLAAAPTAVLGGNVVCSPPVLSLSATQPSGTCELEYLGGGGGPLYAYSVVFTWDGAVAATSVPEVSEGDLLSDEGATFFSPRATGANEITVDCALLGGAGGADGPGTLFTVDFSAVADGTCPVDVTILEVRDAGNNPLTGFEEEDGAIEVDLTVNVAPVITSTPVLSGTVDVAYTYDVEATGVPAPGFVLSVSPLGMHIDGVTGEIDWTPEAAQAGPNDVEVVAANAAGSDTQSFVVEVSDPVGPNVVCVPDTLVLTAGGSAGTVAVDYLGGGGGLLYGYSIVFTWDGDSVSTAPTEVSEGDLLLSAGSTAFFPFVTGPDEITVDCAILGGGGGVTGPGTMFTIDFTGLVEGTSELDLTIASVRDADNDELAGFEGEDGTIEVLAGAPNEPTMSVEPEFTAGGSNTVHWSDESGSGAVEYMAERATDAGFTSGVQTSGWGAALSHAFGGLVDGQLYHYRVKARSVLLAESGWSNVVQSTQDQAPPTTAALDPGEYQVTLSFQIDYTAFDATSGVQYVELWYQKDGGGYVQYSTGSPFTGGTIDFLAPGGGDYNFYTIGTDNVGNVEPAPVAPDCSTVVDVTPPEVSNVLIENVTLAHTNVYIKDGDHARLTATVTDGGASRSIATIKADLTGLGGGASVDPDSYVADVATWDLMTVTCAPSDGLVTVEVTATDNVGSEAQDSDDITADNTPPAAVTGFDAQPGHGECALSWTNGYDAHFAGVLVARRSDAGAYPVYSSLVADWPDVVSHYPGSHEAGVVAFDGTGTSAVDQSATGRNVQYYQAFCYDEARNYGPPAEGARDLATNYWLGDFTDGAGGYDGLADFEDLMFLSLYYGIEDPTGPAAECDVGPTVHPDGDAMGIPLPDRYVGFDDLMIYSLNYASVAPLGGVAKALHASSELSDVAVGRSDLAVALRRLPEGGQGGPADGEMERYALRLERNTGELKGLSAVIVYEPTEMDLHSVESGDHTGSPAADVFFWHGRDRDGSDGRVRIDLAVLGDGSTIEGSGDLAVLTFSGDAASRPRIESVDARDGLNQALAIQIVNGDADAAAPPAFRLWQNSPNPFNPATTIAFETPVEAQVRIAVFDVSGRLVATLEDRRLAPGRYSAEWRGVGDDGRPVGSGVYLCRMETKDGHHDVKMLLLK